MVGSNEEAGAAVQDCLAEDTSHIPLQELEFEQVLVESANTDDSLWRSDIFFYVTLPLFDEVSKLIGMMLYVGFFFNNNMSIICISFIISSIT